MVSAPGNLGSLTLAANGGYTYSVANSAVQFLGATDTRTDSFTVAMNKGACYRLFAVADQTIHDIDIVILRNGAILGTDDMHQPVAIIQGGAPFCPEDDGNYSFDVKVKGEGKGAYTVGIWTRPK